MTLQRTLLTTLSDDQLIAEVKQLAAAERRATAALICSLMELDARRLYLREGCSSLFTYCTQVLHLAEGSAYNRIEVARVARRFPLILDAIAEGSMTLTAVRLLAPHLTVDNHAEVLASASHRSKREVELLIVSLKPKPAVSAVIRKLPVRDGCTLQSPTPVNAAAPRNSIPAPATAQMPAAKATAPRVDDFRRGYASGARTLQTAVHHLARDAR